MSRVDSRLEMTYHRARGRDPPHSQKLFEHVRPLRARYVSSRRRLGPRCRTVPSLTTGIEHRIRRALPASSVQGFPVLSGLVCGRVPDRTMQLLSTCLQHRYRVQPKQSFTIDLSTWKAAPPFCRLRLHRCALLRGRYPSQACPSSPTKSRRSFAPASHLRDMSWGDLTELDFSLL